jgi:hypothetical protein
MTTCTGLPGSDLSSCFTVGPSFETEGPRRDEPLGAASGARFMRGVCRRQPGWLAGAGRNVAAKTWK